tara:strand:- start:139 stop:912 length:774 start_codon:yes stop_codon:yes gene_type:complete
MGGNSMRKQRQTERNWQPPNIETLTQRQDTYLGLLNKHPCTIAAGPAGTGKTYVACAWAGSQLKARVFSQLVLVRPNEGVGKSLGMLPGNLDKKLDPWARPLVEAIKSQMGSERFNKAKEAGEIKIEALEHIRGLTFDNSVMIIDEAQNTSPKEMKAFLTRVGRNSSIIITGDESQSDIHAVHNGLAWAMRAVDRGLVPDVGRVHFTYDDVVRSELCKQWGMAFEALEQEQREEREYRVKAPEYRGSLNTLRSGQLI